MATDATMVSPRQQNRFPWKNNAMIRTSSRRLVNMRDPVVVQEQLLILARIQNRANQFRAAVWTSLRCLRCLLNMRELVVIQEQLMIMTRTQNQGKRLRPKNATVVRTSSRRSLDMMDPVIIQEQLVVMTRIQANWASDGISGLASASPFVAGARVGREREGAAPPLVGGAGAFDARGTKPRLLTRSGGRQKIPLDDEPAVMKRTMQINKTIEEAGAPAEVYPGRRLRIRGEEDARRAIASVRCCAVGRGSLRVYAAAELV